MFGEHVPDALFLFFVALTLVLALPCIHLLGQLFFFHLMLSMLAAICWLRALLFLCPCLNTPLLLPLPLVKRGQSTYDYIKELRQKEAADSRNVEAAREASEPRRASRFSTQDTETQEERGRCCCRPRPVSPEA